MPLRVRHFYVSKTNGQLILTRTKPSAIIELAGIVVALVIAGVTLGALFGDSLTADPSMVWVLVVFVSGLLAVAGRPLYRSSRVLGLETFTFDRNANRFLNGRKFICPLTDIVEVVVKERSALAGHDGIGTSAYDLILVRKRGKRVKLHSWWNDQAEIDTIAAAICDYTGLVGPTRQTLPPAFTEFHFPWSRKSRLAR